MGEVTVWSHDGSSFAGNEPRESMDIAAEEGIFGVVLGGEHMAPLHPENLAYPNLQLRDWIGDEQSGFEQLAPDQPITSTPYAMMAGGLPHGAANGQTIADGSIELHHLSPQAQGASLNNLDHLELGDQDTYGSPHIFHNNTGEPSLILDRETAQITAKGNGQ